MPDVNLLRCPSCGDFPSPWYLEVERADDDFSKANNALEALLLSREPAQIQCYKLRKAKYIDDQRCGQVCHCSALHGIDWEALYKLPSRPIGQVVCDLRMLLGEGETRQRQAEKDASVVPHYAGWWDACNLTAYEAYRAGAFAHDRTFSFVVQQLIKQNRESASGPDFCCPSHYGFIDWLAEFWLPIIVPGWGSDQSDDRILALAEFLRLLQGYAVKGNLGEEDNGDYFHELALWAAAELKGKQRRCVELLAEEKGAVPIADLACDNAIDWGSDFDEPFKSMVKALTPKLGKQGWRIYRHDNEARIQRTGQK